MDFIEDMKKSIKTALYCWKILTQSSCKKEDGRHIGFGQTENSTIRSADPENPTVEPNIKWIGRPLAEIWPFEIFPSVRSLVGRRSIVGRSVGPQYILLPSLR